MSNNQDDKFTILLIADNYDSHFAPITVNTSWGQWQLAGVRLLDLALEWISLIGTPNYPHILVVSSTLSDEDLGECQRKWAYNFKSFRAVHCKDCNSTGQIIREVESRGLLSNGEFMLIENLATFCSSNLSNQINLFRTLRKKDKHCVMSLLYSLQISGDSRFLGFETDSGKLIMHQNNKDKPGTKISREMFTNQITIRGDLAYCGIALCSTEVLHQFSDNFDLEHMDEVISEILVNEEVHCQTIRIEILPEDIVAFTVSDYGSLLRAQRLLIHRWCYPLAYDNLPARVFANEIPLRYHRMHVYVPRNEEAPSNAEGTVLGRQTNISSSAELVDVTMGSFGVVEEGVKMHSVIAGHNFKVGRDSIIDGAVIGDNVTIGVNVKIGAKTVIGSNVVIPDGAHIYSHSAIMATAPPEDNDDIKFLEDEEKGYFIWKLKDEISGHFWKRSHSFKHARRERTASSHSVVSGHTSVSMDNSIGEDVIDGPVQADVILDTDFYFKTFVTEVRDSMNEVYKASNRSDPPLLQKLIMEINSSKLANNVCQEDVARGVFFCFLSMPVFNLQLDMKKKLVEVEKLFTDWKIVWNNYYRPEKSKIQLLVALEEAAKNDDTVSVVLPGLIISDTVLALLSSLIMMVYNELDDFSEDVIFSWYHGLTDGSEIKKKAKDAIDVLEEPDSDEETDDSEDAYEMNRPKPYDGVNRTRNMMLKGNTYAGQSSSSDKVFQQRQSGPSHETSYAVQTLNSNYHNPFIPVFPRIADPCPMPVIVEKKNNQK
ncbi:hypothetical protein FO519_000985 [Halicephalobus sp. NKZ332]|nr:hypothetical protein FO519_000985 [Halicephalobus sp. NKZ332]